MKNSQINAYTQNREPKYHEQVLLTLLNKRHSDFSGKILDIGCAAGSFFELINDSFSQAEYHGFDISDDLINLARKKFDSKNNYHFEVSDALSYQPKNDFELIIASGVLGIFEDFETPLLKWLSWLTPRGTAYVFGCFNSKNVDTVVRFRNNFTNAEWEGGLTSFSVYTVGSFLEKHGFKYEFIKFELPFSLPEEEDPIRSYTRETVDGEILILNGANLLTEFYHLVINKA